MRQPNRRGAGERSRRPVTGQVTEDTSGVKFETDKDITDTPTQWVPLQPLVKALEITEVYHRITPTNAVTYRLMLFRGPLADDTLHEAELVYDSGPLRVSGQSYKETQGGLKLPAIARLTTAGYLYYAVDWSAAPGNTTGVLVVKGFALVGDL